MLRVLIEDERRAGRSSRCVVAGAWNKTGSAAVVAGVLISLLLGCSNRRETAEGPGPLYIGVPLWR